MGRDLQCTIDNGRTWFKNSEVRPVRPRVKNSEARACEVRG